MKHRLLTSCAMTLIELLVASILVGIVIIGALSADYAIRSWKKRIDNRTYTQMDLSLAMTQITKRGKEATGTSVCDTIESGPAECMSLDAITQNLVGLSYDYTKDDICFLNDPDPTSVDEDETLYCYYTQLDDATLKSYTLTEKRYTYKAAGSIDITKDLMTIIDENVVNDATNAPFFTIVFDDNGLVKNIVIHLTACPDPTSAEDSVNNPNYSLGTSFYPAGLSQ